MASAYFIDFHVLSEFGLSKVCERLREELAENTADEEFIGDWSQAAPEKSWGFLVPGAQVGVVWDSFSASRVEGLCAQAFDGLQDPVDPEGLVAAIFYGPSLTDVHMVLATSAGRKEMIQIPSSVLEPLLGKSMDAVWEDEDEELIDKVGDLALPLLANKSVIVESFRALQEEKRLDEVLPPAPSVRCRPGRV